MFCVSARIDNDGIAIFYRINTFLNGCEGCFRTQTVVVVIPVDRIDVISRRVRDSNSVQMVDKKVTAGR